jgi:hypothetical protein
MPPRKQVPKASLRDVKSLGSFRKALGKRDTRDADNKNDESSKRPRVGSAAQADDDDEIMRDEGNESDAGFGTGDDLDASDNDFDTTDNISDVEIKISGGIVSSFSHLPSSSFPTDICNYRMRMLSRKLSNRPSRTQVPVQRIKTLSTTLQSLYRKSCNKKSISAMPKTSSRWQITSRLVPLSRRETKTRSLLILLVSRALICLHHTQHHAALRKPRRKTLPSSSVISRLSLSLLRYV